MFIEKVTTSIVNTLDAELHLDKDNKAVVYYGTFALVQMILSISLVFVLGFILGVPIFAMILSVVTSSLRKYSGGTHAENSRNCIILGTIICLSQAKLIEFLTIYIQFNTLISAGIIIFVVSFWLIYKLAPVDSVKKPIRKEEKKRKMKKRSLMLLFIYFVLTLVLLSINNLSFFPYITCIYMGIIWQVFTITKLGHLILGKLDTLLNHIFSLLEGERK